MPEITLQVPLLRVMYAACNQQTAGAIAMPGPTKNFNYSVILIRTAPGQYRVSSQANTVYSGTYSVYDDVGADNNAVLGDVTNDTFHVQLSGVGTTVTQTYRGKQTGGDGSGFISTRNGSFYLYTNDPSYGPTTPGGFVSKKGGQTVGFTADNPSNPATQQALCYASGTLIRTTRGEVAVEELVVGDVAVTASGAHRAIRWLGHRHVDLTTRETRADMRPVRILAGAFGDGLPARDLSLSPGHPVLVGADEDGAGGHLVPVMCLINGTTIDRVTVDSVSYWHVELDAHDILLAEGLPTESYLDWGDRAFFSEAEEHALFNPDFVVPGLGARCRPVALNGPVVEAERRRLDAAFATRLATACAWPEGDLLAS